MKTNFLVGKGCKHREQHALVAKKRHLFIRLKRLLPTCFGAKNWHFGAPIAQNGWEINPINPYIDLFYVPNAASGSHSPGDLPPVFSRGGGCNHPSWSTEGHLGVIFLGPLQPAMLSRVFLGPPCGIGRQGIHRLKGLLMRIPVVYTFIGPFCTWKKLWPGH